MERREIKDASSSSGSSGSSSEEEKLSDASNHPEQQLTKETLNADKEEDCSSEETVNAEKEEEEDNSSDEVSSSEEEKVTKNSSDPVTEKEDEESEDEDEEKEIAPKETESETSSELQPKQTDFILALKRPAADIAGIGETSNAKKARVTENREGKKSPYGRVFSEEDELVLLEGMVKYFTKRSVDPSTDIGGFYNSVKDLLQVRVTKLQVSEKVRRMKQRYLNSVGKEVGDSVSTDARKLEIFRLGEQIWGKLSVNGADSGGKSKKTKSSKGGTILNEEIQRLDDEPVLSKDEFFSRYPQIIRLLSNEHSFMKKNVHLIGSQKAKELDEELNKLFVREIEIFSKKTMLAAELAKALLDVTKLSGNALGRWRVGLEIHRHLPSKSGECDSIVGFLTAGSTMLDEGYSEPGCPETPLPDEECGTRDT